MRRKVKRDHDDVEKASREPIWSETTWRYHQKLGVRPCRVVGDPIVRWASSLYPVEASSSQLWATNGLGSDWILINFASPRTTQICHKRRTLASVPQEIDGRPRNCSDDCRSRCLLSREVPYSRGPGAEPSPPVTRVGL